MYDSCFLTMGCRSESIKLEMRSVGPPFPEIIGLPAILGFVDFSQRVEFRYPGWILTIVEPLESRFVNVFVDIQFIDYKFDFVNRGCYYWFLWRGVVILMFTFVFARSFLRASRSFADRLSCVSQNDIVAISYFVRSK